MKPRKIGKVIGIAGAVAMLAGAYAQVGPDGKSPATQSAMIETGMRPARLLLGSGRKVMVTVNHRVPNGESEAILSGNTVLVPVRAFELAGDRVVWAPRDRSVEIFANSGQGNAPTATAILWDGRNTMTANSQATGLLASPRLVDGQLYVPAVATAKALGQQIWWDGNTSTLDIRSSK